MNYGTLEKELTDRLNAWFAAHTLPDEDGVQQPMSTFFKALESIENEAGANQPFTIGTVWVTYLTSDVADSLSTATVRQEETVTIMLVFATRTKRGPNGLFNLQEATRRCLLGYRPQSATTRLVMAEGFKWEDFGNNSIQPNMKMRFNTLTAQAFEDGEPDIAPAFSNVTYNDIV